MGMNEEDKDTAALGFIIALVGFAVCVLLVAVT